MTIAPDSYPPGILLSADEILAIRDWLEELCELPAVAYNALTHQAILAEEADPAERPATLQLTSDQQAAIDGILQDISQASLSADQLELRPGHENTFTLAARINGSGSVEASWRMRSEPS